MPDHGPPELNPFGRALLGLLGERGLTVSELVVRLREEKGQDVDEEEVWGYITYAPPEEGWRD